MKKQKLNFLINTIIKLINILLIYFYQMNYKIS